MPQLPQTVQRRRNKTLAAFDVELARRLSVLQLAREWGLVTSDKADVALSRDCIELSAVGRDDRNPSARLYVAGPRAGSYCDYGTGQSCDLVGLAVLSGRAVDRRAAREMLAAIVGLKVPKFNRRGYCKNRSDWASGEASACDESLRSSSVIGVAGNAPAAPDSQPFSPRNFRPLARVSDVVASGIDSLDAVTHKLADDALAEFTRTSDTTVAALAACGAWIGVHSPLTDKVVTRGPLRPRRSIAFPIRRAADGPATGLLCVASHRRRTLRAARREVKVALDVGSTSGLVGLVQLQADPSGPVLLTEGVRDAIRVLPHVPQGWSVVAVSHGCNTTHPVEALRGRRVRVVFDGDRPGQDGAEKHAAALRQLGCDAAVIRLPFEIAEKGGADLDDLIESIPAHARKAAVESLLCRPRDGPD